MGTVLTAVLVKYTFPYGWSWVESLLFGAMFSATDPVAVVAVLKEVSTACHVHYPFKRRACSKTLSSQGFEALGCIC